MEQKELLKTQTSQPNLEAQSSILLAKNLSATDGALVVEAFLNANYLLRKNLLSGKVEFKLCKDTEGEFRPLTKEAQNSIVIEAMRKDILEGKDPKSAIDLVLHSEEIQQYNPVGEFIGSLPAWDGQNHVAALFNRLPGLTSEKLHFLSIWLHSVVAHWMQMDMLHGNECVPTLIGAQGCGKTTFLRRLLPPELRMYFMDSINLSNRFDKEMALTNNLLVNLDELEAIRPSQQASLKQTLSISKVNGRPIYGAAQEDKPRFASFTATTNNRHPLTDSTGSRRYICIEIPKGQLIDNSGEIDHQQLYAQVVYELREQKMPYWFTNEEVMRLMELNLDYMEQKDLGEMVAVCFRKPQDNEQGQPMTSAQILKVIRNEYPTVKETHSNEIRIGRMLRELGYENRTLKGRTVYEVLLQKAA